MFEMGRCLNLSKMLLANNELKIADLNYDHRLENQQFSSTLSANIFCDHCSHD